MHILHRSIYGWFRVKIRVTFSIHNMTLVHIGTKSHCSNNLCSLCAHDWQALCATGKMQGMSVCLLYGHQFPELSRILDWYQKLVGSNAIVRILLRRQPLTICILQSTIALSRIRDVCLQHMLLMIVCNWLNAKNVVMLVMDTNSQNKVVYIFDIYTRNSRKHNNAIMASVEEAVTHSLSLSLYIYIIYCIYIYQLLYI